MELLQPEAALRRRTLHCNSTPGAVASTSGCFSPTSIQFKGEINDAFLRKRHRKRYLEFCTAYLLTKQAAILNALLSVAYRFSLLKSHSYLYRSCTDLYSYRPSTKR